MSHCEYSIDADNCVSSVDDTWLAFACGNDAPQLTRENVIGRPMLDFIHGRETRHIYEEIFRKVRESRCTVVLPFRCDAPDRLRFMRLACSTQDGVTLQFSSVLVREEPRAAIELAPASAGDGRSRVTMCSWCKLIDADGEWIEIESAIERLGLFDSADLPTISHGMCSDCYDDAKQQIDAADGGAADTASP